MKIGIVGAGRGGTALMRVLQGISDVTVVGICDINPAAPGLEEAHVQSIATYSSAEELIAAQKMDWLINVSHASLTRRLLLSEMMEGVRIIDGDVSEFIWRILVAFEHETEDTPDSATAERIHARRELAWHVVSETADLIQQAHDRLADIAFRDPLTGLYTRRLLMEFLDKEIAGACSSGQPLALIMIDLDHFKDVNDRFGHDAGDRVLCSFADMMITGGRRGDLASRYGGEEFVMVLSRSGLIDAITFAGRLQSHAERELFRPDGKPQTISIGVAALEPCAKLTVEEQRSEFVAETRHRLLRSADEALYRAKAAGRNCVMAAPQALIPGASLRHL